MIAALTRILVLVVGLGAEYAARARDLTYLPFSEAATFIHYADVVENGYTAQNATQYPLLPTLMWGMNQLGVPIAITGVLISSVLFVVGLVAFAVLGERYVGYEAASNSALLLAIFPFSHFFSLASTESAMLAALCLSVLCAIRGTTISWLSAGLIASFGSLARPPAIFICIVLLGVALSQLKSGQLRGGRIVAAVTAGFAPVLAVIGFFWYLKHRTGDFFASINAQDEYDRASPHLSGPAEAITTALSDIRGGALGVAVDLVAVAIVVIAIVAFWVHARTDRFERAGWVAFAAASMLLPLATGIVWQMSRFALLVPPVFWIAGLLLNGRPRMRDAVVVTLAMALATKVVFEVIGVTQ